MVFMHSHNGDDEEGFVPGAKANVGRILEAIIIAFLTGAISLYGVTKVLETKLTGFEERIQKIEKSEESNTNELKSDIKDLRHMIMEFHSFYNGKEYEQKRR